MTVKSDFMKKVLEEGIEAAYETVLEIAQNPKAPAQSRVAASRTIFEIAGVAKPTDGSLEKEPHEMTIEEIQAKLARLRAEDAARSRPVIDVEPRRIGRKSGVFD